MSRRRPSGRAARPPAIRLAWLILPVSLLTLAAGCDSRDQTPASTPTSTPATAGTGSAGTAGTTYCGQTKTAAQVPVNIEVARGQVPCATALSVMRAYATAIQQGKAPGNGGGGPLRVRGWTCQGFDTPTVLSTGNASKCVKGATEILAVLPNPIGGAPPGTG